MLRWLDGRRLVETGAIACIQEDGLPGRLDYPAYLLTLQNGEELWAIARDGERLAYERAAEWAATLPGGVRVGTAQVFLAGIACIEKRPGGWVDFRWTAGGRVSLVLRAADWYTLAAAHPGGALFLPGGEE